MIMKGLFAFQISEEKQALSRLNIVVALLILAMGLGFLQYHLSEYKKKEEQKAVFQDVEKIMIETYPTYRHYASYGFQMLFHPAPISVLFSNSTVFQDMMANIETGHRLNIYQSLKSSTPFDLTKFLFADCSGIYLCFVGLLAIFYGYMAFLHTEYLKFLASLTGKKKLFISIFLSRANILVQFSLIYLASAVLLITINGVAVGIDQYLAALFIKMCGVSLAFFALGAVFGLCESIFVGLAGAIASWLIPLFIIPFIVSVIVSANSGTIKPENQLEIEKLKLMMDHEKRFNNETGILPLNKTPTERQSELVLGYYKNEFQKIKALEELLIAQMQECTKLHYMLSAFFPTTGYLALTQEISSKGYENLYAFYQTVIQTKEAFFKEYMKQVYFSSSSEPAKVEPFLKGDDNIYRGKPALPGYMLLDFFFNLLWIVGLTIPAYYGFKKRLFELPLKKLEEKEPKDAQIEHANIVSWRVYKTGFSSVLYNLLSNQIRELVKKGYQFKMTIYGQLLNTAKKGMQFLYLCPPTEIPGNFVTGHFVDLLMGLMKLDKTKRKEIKSRFSLDSIKKKKIKQLEIAELGRVYLAILEMKTFPIYLIDDVPKGMLLDFCTALKQKIFELYENDSIILFLSSEAHYHYSEKNQVKLAEESLAWFKKINALLDEKEVDEMDNEETDEDKDEIFLK